MDLEKGKLDQAKAEIDAAKLSIEQLRQQGLIQQAQQLDCLLYTSYMKNEQIILVKTDSDYQTLEDLAGKTIGVDVYKRQLQSQKVCAIRRPVSGRSQLSGASSALSLKKG